MSVIDKIRQTDWRTKATNYKDRHYDASSGVMLSDHLDSVYNSIDRIFTDTKSQFISELAQEKYFHQIGLQLPILAESDIR